ncbi:MAG: response regulator [Pseudomonadales bacterium]|nr:response regulator [Pseudomonadales bacterium]
MRTLFCHSFSLLLLLILPGIKPLAQTLNTPQSFHNLAPHSAFIEDPNNSLNINQVLSTETLARFQKFNQDIPFFGLTRSIFWIHIPLSSMNLPPLLSGNNNWILELGPPKHVQGLDRGGIEMFLVDANGAILSSAQMGSYANTAELKTIRGGFAYRLSGENLHDVFLRVESARELRIPLTLWQENSFYDKSSTADIGLGLEYGILLAMILYNLFLLISIKERSLLFYILVASSQLLFLFLDSKHARLLIPDNNVLFWIINILERDIYLLMGIAYLQFQRVLLDVRQHNQLMDNLLKALIIICTGSLVMSMFTSEKPVQFIYLILIPVSLILILITNVDAIRKGVDTAKVHLAATLAFLSGAGIQLSYQVWQIFPETWLTSQAFHFGMLSQSLMLAFGLAYRYNKLKLEIENAQQLAINNLQHAEKIKDNLLSNVSHELRTPVHSINSLSHITREKLNNTSVPTQEIYENLNLIDNSARRLLKVIDDLLDLASIKNQQITLHLQALNLYLLTEDVLKTAKPLIGNKPIKLLNNIKDETCTVIADEKRLKQILLNLISNAIKFTPKGEINISVEPKDEAHLRLAVTDTGIGISPDEQNQIFNAFEKGNTPVDIQAEGIGLGLAISQRLVELHGSKLDLCKNPGRGTKFSFDLPLTGSEELIKNQGSESGSKRLLKRSDYSPSPLPVSHLKSEKASILIVDDEAINRMVISQQLSGHNVIQASGGAEALSIINKQKPDLVLLDLMMPGMSGYDVCKEIRRTYNQVQLPIIILTARNHLEDLNKGLELGANDYISKPYHHEELIARINNQLKLLPIINQFSGNRTLLK